MRIILPERTYSKDELALILRHELIHWGRDDASTKLFLTFCTALCWINPFTWYAMRRSADDLELSCDESVLWDADETSRRQYAELLLTTAADDRGFTSNLSNSAKALRYRLQKVMRPREKATGAMVLAVIFYLLFVTCGYAAIPYAKTSGADAFSIPENNQNVCSTLYNCTAKKFRITHTCRSAIFNVKMSRHCIPICRDCSYPNWRENLNIRRAKSTH